jgi:hypothetical protein
MHPHVQAKLGAVCGRLGYGGLAQSYFAAAQSLIVSEKLDVMPKYGKEDGNLIDADWLLVSSLFLSQQGARKEGSACLFVLFCLFVCLACLFVCLACLFLDFSISFSFTNSFVLYLLYFSSHT